MRSAAPASLALTYGVAALGGLAVAGGWLPAAAQAPLRGQPITTAYEGFWKNADGSFDLLFGYFNRNWEEAIDVPIGTMNNVQPGGPDRGQPTHFFPRRNQFVFKVRVPADFGEREVAWTLTSHGETSRAFGTLRPAYVVDEIVMMANFGAGGPTGFDPSMLGNRPPAVKLEVPKKLTARVGQPVALSAVASDDGKPAARPMPSLLGQSHFVPNSANGLRHGSSTGAPDESSSTRRRSRSGRTTAMGATHRGRPDGRRRRFHPTTGGRSR